MSADYDETKSELFAIVFGQNVKRPQSLEMVYEELKYIRFTETAIKGVLKKLPSKKAIAPEKLGNNIRKKTAAYMAKSLELVVQTIVSKGIFPNCWKLARVSPIFKEGNKTDVSSYRTISPLCCILKVLG